MRSLCFLSLQKWSFVENMKCYNQNKQKALQSRLRIDNTVNNIKKSPNGNNDLTINVLNEKKISFFKNTAL